ncbi:FTR1 family protein [Singulisphaera sp. PoT]|uniref:FTR1 family protein n=1 Tax=Singulisphaera sp. PoT TaxID=3411797 RepID=UPI003BF48971
MRFALILAWLSAMAATQARGASEVSGKVEMPDICRPEVSPAVASLEPAQGTTTPAAPASNGPTEMTLVDQRGLQFVPRVQAMTLGGTVQFHNSDSETHSVHTVTPGFGFNMSMGANRSENWVPEKAGVVRLACDVHGHMKGYIVVSPSPWVAVCSREGRFKFRDVPAGRYTLKVWHEMGDPLTREVEVREGSDVGLEGLTLTTTAVATGKAAVAPVLPWTQVIDNISVNLAASLESASRPGQLKKARRLAEDSYWGEFEVSDMETAVRMHLGFARKGELEGKFYAIFSAVRKVADGKLPANQLADLNRDLLLDLVKAANELNSKGVTDSKHLHIKGAAANKAAAADASVSSVNPREQLARLTRGLNRIREQAENGEASEAASAMTTVYFSDFEPIERYLDARKPQEVRPLEIRFNAIRGEVDSGLKGADLSARFDGLVAEVETALAKCEAQRSGTFGPAFVESLVLILREGIEVILLLTMLLALVAKTEQPGALKAIWWGVGLAVVASALTALGLNLLVSSARGRAREVVEGLVMLAASGVLFYVSYWLISQSESKRWMDFLKRHAKVGGVGTLALTAFLAVYREGAETALLYQAMIGAQGQTRPGMIGLLSGIGVGLVLLVGVAIVIRATSVRLPLRAFFKVSGIVLFGMAVVFAGNGVFELQSSGMLKTTQLSWLSWLGEGVPLLGIYPTVQTISVQALMLVGAGLALALLLSGDSSAAPAGAPASKPPLGPAPTAGARV